MWAAEVGADVKGLAADRLKLAHETTSTHWLTDRGDLRGQLTDQRIQCLAFPIGYAQTLLNRTGNMPNDETVLLCNQHHAMWLNAAWNMNWFTVTNGQVNRGGRHTHDIKLLARR